MAECVQLITSIRVIMRAPTGKGPAIFEGVFEIGLVDGQTAMTLNALGPRSAWNVLLPMCDFGSNLQPSPRFWNDRLFGCF